MIRRRVYNIAHVTLHVGLGTFRPVKAENILEHHMHSEFYTDYRGRGESGSIRQSKRAEELSAVGTTSCTYPGERRG